MQARVPEKHMCHGQFNNNGIHIIYIYVYMGYTWYIYIWYLYIYMVFIYIHTYTGYIYIYTEMGINPTNITQQYDVCGTVIHPMPIGITCSDHLSIVFPGKPLVFHIFFCFWKPMASTKTGWCRPGWHGWISGHIGSEYLVYLQDLWKRIMCPMILPKKLGQIYHSGWVIVMVPSGKLT
jgi:hypothetical protein